MSHANFAFPERKACTCGTTIFDTPERVIPSRSELRSINRTPGYTRKLVNASSESSVRFRKSHTYVGRTHVLEALLQRVHPRRSWGPNPQ